MRTITKCILSVIMVLQGAHLWAQNETPETPASTTEESVDVDAVSQQLEQELEEASTLELAEAAVIRAMDAGLSLVEAKAIAMRVASNKPLITGLTILQVVPPPPTPDGSNTLGGVEQGDEPGDEPGGDSESKTTLGGSTTTGGDGHIPVGQLDEDGEGSGSVGGDSSNTGSTYN